MHMTRTRDHDSHAGGRILDYSIKCPLTLLISPEFYSLIGYEGLSSKNKQKLVSDVNILY
jgi:hypothetical protein